MGPYTTFQQLLFAPPFPLAAIADECVIPPDYPAFVRWRDLYDPPPPPELEAPPETVESLSPPGLPVPPSQPPSRWYYKDPRGVVQGPWKGALMQQWFKDGFLPLDLPVRRENETEFILLRDLRAQSVDPSHPFRPPPPSLADSKTLAIPQSQPPLLAPISLLKQPAHFGPPALFFSSRGGHSTSVVDARGKSVLKGRLAWTGAAALGDVRRVEAFSARNNERAVVVALRATALEAMDVGDALLAPGDESRTALPDYAVSPTSAARRAPFVWRVGSPLATAKAAGGGEGLAPLAEGKRRALAKVIANLPLDEQDLHTLPNPNEEVLFLAREGDDMYFCEKGSVSFRIMRLSTIQHAAQ